jgi:hypothetical protein
LAVLAADAAFTPAAGPTTTIRAALLVPTVGLAVHALAVEFKTPFLEREFEALVKGHPDAAEIEDAEIEFLSQFRHFLPLRTLLKAAPAVGVRAGEVHHAADDFVAGHLSPGLAVAAIAFHAIGAPATTATTTIAATLLITAVGRTATDALFVKPATHLAHRRLLKATGVRGPFAANFEDAEEEFEGDITERVGAHALLDEPGVGIRRFKLHHALEHFGTGRGLTAHALAAITLGTWRAGLAFGPALVGAQAIDHSIALASRFPFRAPALQTDPSVAMHTIRTDATVVARAIAGTAFLEITLRHTIFNAFAVHAEEARRARLFQQLRTGLVAHKHGELVETGNQSGFADGPVLADTCHANKIIRTLGQVGPPRAVLGANAGLIPHTPQGPRVALVGLALVFQSVAPGLCRTLHVRETLDAVAGQVVTHSPRRAAVAARQQAGLVEALTCRAIAVFDTLDADLFRLKAGQPLGTIAIFQAVGHGHARPLLALVLVRTVSVAHTHHAGMGEGIADPSGTVFVGFTPLGANHDIFGDDGFHGLDIFQTLPVKPDAGRCRVGTACQYEHCQK